MSSQLERVCRDEIDVRKNLNAEEQLYNQLDETALSMLGEEGMLKFPPGFGDFAQTSGIDDRKTAIDDDRYGVKKGDDSQDFGLYNQLDSTASSMIGEGGVLKKPMVCLEDGTKNEGDFADTSSHADEMEVKPLIVGNEYLAYEEIQSKRWERIVAILSYCTIFAIISACFVGRSEFVKFHLSQSISMFARACITALKCAIVLGVVQLLVNLLAPVLLASVGEGFAMFMKYITIPIAFWYITVFALGKYLVMCIKCADEAFHGVYTKHDDISFLGLL